MFSLTVGMQIEIQTTIEAQDELKVSKSVPKVSSEVISIFRALVEPSVEVCVSLREEATCEQK